MNYTYTDELYHHGILGQKWGVRRFQNEDGSYTAAGRDRYGIGGKRIKFSKASVNENGSGHIKDQHRAVIEQINSLNVSDAKKQKLLAKENKSYKEALKNQSASDKLKWEHEKKQELFSQDKDKDKNIIREIVKKAENYSYNKALQKQEKINTGRDKFEKALLIGGGVAVAAIAGYGIYRMASKYRSGSPNADIDIKELTPSKPVGSGYNEDDKLFRAVNSLSENGDQSFAQAINFTNSHAANNYHVETNFSEKLWHSLDYSEREGIKNYTGSSYVDMNTLLRTGNCDAPNKADIEHYIDGCTRALEKSRIKEDCVVHRGIGGALGKMLNMSSEELKSAIKANPDALVGKTFTDKGFVSTGVAQGDAWSGTKMHIFVPAGSKGMYVDPISTCSGEHELLLQRNSTFTIKKVVTNSQGKITDILVELIDQTL